MLEHSSPDDQIEQPPVLNISARAKLDSPGYLLSNLAETPFYLVETDENGDEVQRYYRSMESWWKGLYQRPGSARRLMSVLSGREAQRIAKPEGTREIEYNGQSIGIGSQGHHTLMEMAIRAKIAQREDVRAALLQTGDAVLIHTTYDRQGSPHPDSSAIPAAVFTDIWTRIRHELQEE